MYSYSYKLNNSNSIIVVPFLYQKNVVKQGYTKMGNKILNIKGTYTSTSKPKIALKKVAPLQNGTPLAHKKFGLGRIVNTNDKGYIFVRFAEQVKKFVYPDAILQGYLTKIAVL